MKCKNCGAENLDDAVVCVECGKDPSSIGRMDAKDCKHWMGVLLALASVIGLAIGLIMYWKNPWKRRTFLGGWVIATVLIAVVALAVFGWAIACDSCTNYFEINCGNRLK